MPPPPSPSKTGEGGGAGSLHDYGEELNVKEYPPFLLSFFPFSFFELVMISYVEPDPKKK